LGDFFNAFNSTFKKKRTMKTIAVNSIKGGTGKSTLCVLLINALTNAGFRCLAVDADASNNSLSFYLNTSATKVIKQGKTIFNLFVGEPLPDCITRVNDTTSLVSGDVR
jgi:chromosome partitioning protein